MQHFRVVVLGAGVNGLATLWQLSRRGVFPLAIVEQFERRHGRGSSHGQSRITRSAYGDADYVRLMQIAHQEEWPRLEQATGRKLIHACDGVILGEQGSPEFARYADAVASVGVAVRRLTPGEAAERFPQFQYETIGGVLHDTTAGLVAADATLGGLWDLADSCGATRFERCAVTNIDRDRDPIRLTLSPASGQGIDVTCDRFVVTAGAWLPKLFPELATSVTPIRQTVGYFTLDLPTPAQQVGSFPVWIRLGAGPNEMFYGLPAFGRPGVKAARHRVAGVGDDPDLHQAETAPDAQADLLAFCKRHFSSHLTNVEGYESCFYTNTRNEDFLLGAHPEDPRVILGSACSGHGFKFGPLTGRILAELALEGKTNLPEFEACKQRFAIGWLDRSTSLFPQG